MTHARAALASVVLSLLLWGRDASADLYSWVDPQGVIHFTNVRPKGRTPFKKYEGEGADDFGGKPAVVESSPNGQRRVLFPVDVKTYDEILRQAADHYKLPFAFLKAIAKVESNFNPKAISAKQAKGLMQLIDDTAKDMSVEDPFDPEQNVFGGARYLRVLANMFNGNMALTAAAYNAGPDRVLRAKGIPGIEETRQYVRRVLVMYRHYRRNE